MAFTYNLIARVLNLVFSLPVAWLYDKFGRRPLLFIGTAFTMVWLIMLGALGGQTVLTETALKAVVASVILLQVGCYLGLSQGCWIVGPEIGSALLRRKSEFSPNLTSVGTERKQWQQLSPSTLFQGSRCHTLVHTCWTRWGTMSGSFSSDLQ